MPMTFAPATRESVYAKIAIHGPGGSGKTFTGLTILHRLCKKIAVIDTERGRSKKYVGVNGWQFDIAEPQEFAPESLVAGLAEAAEAGYDGLMIDSGSHFWSGRGGMLERVDAAAASGGRNDTFGSGWKAMSPVERRMFDAVLSYPGHLVMCLRVKTEYVIEEVERNGRVRKEPVKVGLRPDQRREFDYEFDLVLGMDRTNTATVMKTDIVTVPMDSVIPKPGPDFADTIADFLVFGDQATSPLVYRDRALLIPTLDELATLREEVFGSGLGHAAVMDGDRNPTTLDELLTARARQLKPQAPARQPTTDKSKRKPPADPQEALRQAVDYVLHAKDADDAAQRLQWAANSAKAGEDVQAALTTDDRDALGIAEGQGFTLLGLAEKAIAYSERHTTGPRVPPPADATPGDAAEVAAPAEEKAVA